MIREYVFKSTSFGYTTVVTRVQLAKDASHYPGGSAEAARRRILSSETPRSGKLNYVGGSDRQILYMFYKCTPYMERITSTDDKVVEKVDGFVETCVQHVVPGKHLPLWMAYCKWNREAEKGYQDNCDMFIGMFRDVEEKNLLYFHAL